MIFAAGLGTRLKPITDRMPKALVPVDGKPLIEHVARKLRNAGFEEAVVNVHHFADMVEAWAKEQDWMKFSISDERAMLLETGGAVLHARKLLEGCGNFLIHNVDIFTNADLADFASKHRTDAIATLLVSRRKTSRYFLFDPRTMRLCGWTNVNTGETIMADASIAAQDYLMLGFSGIHIMSEKIFPLMEEYVRTMGISDNDGAGAKFAIRDFYLWAAACHPIYGVDVPDFKMIDVGKIDSLEAVSKWLEFELGDSGTAIGTRE